MNTGGQRWRHVVASSDLGAWLLIVCWAVVVLVLLTEPHLDNEGRQRIRFGFFEFGHAVFFAILGFLLAHGLIRSRLPRYAWWTVVTLTLYGIAGELMQATVPGRSPSIVDIGADATGALVGALSMTVLARWQSGAPLARALRIWPHVRHRPSDPAAVSDGSMVSPKEQGWNVE